MSVYDARGNGNGEVCPTVCSHPKGGVHDYEPIAVQANGWQFGNVSSTLCGDHENRVTDYTVLCIEKKTNVYSVENHSADSRVTIRDDDKCQTLTSRMGTGGNNVPMILEIVDE